MEKKVFYYNFLAKNFCIYPTFELASQGFFKFLFFFRVFLVRESSVSGGFVISYTYTGKLFHSQVLPVGLSFQSLGTLVNTRVGLSFQSLGTLGNTRVGLSFQSLGNLGNTREGLSFKSLGTLGKTRVGSSPYHPGNLGNTRLCLFCYYLSTLNRKGWFIIGLFILAQQGQV